MAIRPGADDADLGDRPGQTSDPGRRPASWPVSAPGRRRTGPARSSSLMIKSASASSSAANAAARSAVARPARSTSSARYGAGAAPESLLVGELPAPRHRGSPAVAPVDSAALRPLTCRRRPARPSPVNARGSRRRSNIASAMPSSVGLRTGQHPVLVQGVLDDHRDRVLGARSGWAAGRRRPSRAADPGSTRAARCRRACGGDRPVVAVQADLQPAAQRQAVEEGEGRHRRACAACRRPRARSGRCATRLLAVGDLADQGQVGTRGEDERLAGDRDRGDVVPGQSGVDRGVQRGQAARSRDVFGLAWSWPLSRVINTAVRRCAAARRRGSGRG